MDKSSISLKPVFLSKTEREQAALQRVPEEATQQRRCSGQSFMGKSAGDNEQGRASDHKRDQVTERRKRRSEDDVNAREQKARLDKVEEEKKRREMEVKYIKEQYLGSKKVKRHVAKPSEKFRFSFDWETSSDTSVDLLSALQKPHEVQLLFGRGVRAGIDLQQQKKLAVGFYRTFDLRTDTHWSEKRYDEMTERDWRIFREDHDISYKGSKIPRPMRNWEEGKLSLDLLKAVKREGFKTPSPIQMAAIPLGLQQRDVIGVAETGSGKTVAFVLPMLSYIARLPPITRDNEADGPYALVLAPTRELAQQIKDETVKFARYMGIKVVCIVGGELIEEQGFKVSQGCELVIATPNRLLHCLESRYIVLNQCNYIVLDEADRMIDMGFEKQLSGILDAMPSTNLKPENEDEELEYKKIYRTTYMFSATMPSSVERLARKYLRNPVVVTVGTAGKATDRITQNVMMIEEPQKMVRLLKLLDDLGDSRAIVFVNTKIKANTLSQHLDRAGYNVTALHGEKVQEQRQTSLDGFRSKRYNVLVATNVLARGIDVADVAHVINYDMPECIETYTHRIGRTGRVGKTGVATTFLTSKDTNVFFDLKQMLIQSNSPVPPRLAYHDASKFKPSMIQDKPHKRN